MKIKLLSFLLAGCLLAIAAWVVYRNNLPDGMSPSGFATTVQGGDRQNPDKYRDTVYKGLEYLVTNQANDGHWEGDDGKHHVAMTGLCGLALHMEGEAKLVSGFGETVPNFKYSANIRKAADWLMDRSHGGRDGLIFSEHSMETNRYMQGHGLATLFLAGTLKCEQDDARRKKLTDVVSRAIKYILKSQSTEGGWYYTSKVEGHDFADISATAIQLQAMQAAENAGISIVNESIEKGKDYLKRAIEKYEEGASAKKNDRRTADTASAFACLYNNEGRGKDELGQYWFKYCKGEIAVGGAMKFGRDELTHYYFAQVVFNVGGEEWGSYRTAMFDHLQNSQNNDGSWPASDDIAAGPVYATALWCTVLHLDKGNHPSRRRAYPVAL